MKSNDIGTNLKHPETIKNLSKKVSGYPTHNFIFDLDLEGPWLQCTELVSLVTRAQFGTEPTFSSFVSPDKQF